MLTTVKLPTLKVIVFSEWLEFPGGTGESSVIIVEYSSAGDPGGAGWQKSSDSLQVTMHARCTNKVEKGQGEERGCPAGD